MKYSSVVIAYAVLILSGFIIGSYAAGMILIKATSFDMFAGDDDMEMFVYLTLLCAGFLLAIVSLILMLFRVLRSTATTTNSKEGP